jgi:hypothetical protein
MFSVTFVFFAYFVGSNLFIGAAVQSLDRLTNLLSALRARADKPRPTAFDVAFDPAATRDVARDLLEALRRGNCRVATASTFAFVNLATKTFERMEGRVLEAEERLEGVASCRQLLRDLADECALEGSN